MLTPYSNHTGRKSSSQANTTSTLVPNTFNGEITMNTATVTKRNLVAQVSQKQKRALGRARIKRNERTGSEALGSAQVESAMTADTTKRDVIQRKAKNRKRMKSARALESSVLDLDLDWLAFNDLLFGALIEVGCDGDTLVPAYSGNYGFRG